MSNATVRAVLRYEINRGCMSMAKDEDGNHGDHGVGEKTTSCCTDTEINERLKDGHERMNRIEVSMDERMDRFESAIDGTRKDMAEVLEIIMLAKSFFRVAGFMGSAIKWAASVGTPVVAFYFALKGNQK